VSIYATSDLHGYPLKGFLELLKKSGFSDSDFLFVIGDVIDRNGDGGVDLLRWMALQPNVELILGNHEKMMLDSSFVFDPITEENLEALGPEKTDALSLWLFNGGDKTLSSLRMLWKKDPEAVGDILSFCSEAPLFETVTAGGREFLLLHGGLTDFSPERKLSSYAPDEILWARPDPGESYFEDVMTVIGHTPTQIFGDRYEGKAFRTPTWIDIDTGAGFGGSPMLLRLDDLKEFYF
jgi:serine/threonine protein phosphatase 1